MLHKALQIIRSDPSSATGFAPSELLLGRKLVYPIELSKKDIDMSGTEFTAPLVKKLGYIHEKNFCSALVSIKKSQKRYKKYYDQRKKTKNFNCKIGDKVQYLRYKSKRVYSKANLTPWCPFNSYHVIASINYSKKTVILSSREGNILYKSHPFDRIKKYKG